MATESNLLKRHELISWFEGINSSIGDNISKKEELSHAENARSVTIGTIEKRKGYRRLGNTLAASANYGLVYFADGAANATNNGMYRVSTVSSTTSIYYLNNSNVWTALTGGGTSLTAAQCSFTMAETNLFVVNGTDANRYVTSDGTTVVTETTVTGHLKNSPVANKINYYKSKLYLGDYTIGSKDYPTGIMMSSVPLGIVALVDGDHSQPTTSLKVTDTKYIFSTDTLQIYRGGTLITGSTNSDATTQIDVSNPSGTTFRYTFDGTGTAPLFSTYFGVGSSVTTTGFNAANNGTFTVTAVAATYFEITNASGVAEVNITSTTFTINTISVTAKTEDTLTIASFKTNIESADEIWINGTYTGTRVFRWAGNPASGENVKQYDTFKLSGGNNDRIRMFTNIGDVMMIANKNNMAAWNDYNLQNFDGGIGCVSDNGFVKANNALFFIHYDGIYATTGGKPQLISAKVQKYIDGATRTGLDDTAAGKKGDSIFFHIGTVTLTKTDGSEDKTLTNCVLEFNLIQSNWYIHTGINAKMFATYQTSGDPDILEWAAENSTSTSYVYEFLYGLVDDAVTSDDSIPMRVDSQKIYLAKEFEKFIYPKKIIIEALGGHNIKVFISLDDDPFYEIKGEAMRGCTVLYINAKSEDEESARCRGLKLSIREFGKGICILSRVALIYALSSEEEEHSD